VTKPHDHVEIQDEGSHTEDEYVLYVGGSRQAAVTRKAGLVEFHWYVDGPQYWPKAKDLIRGILDLSVIADQLDQGGKHE
jgi:hypothetical protein